MRQHLACVEAAKMVSGAQVEGAEPGSTHLSFQPGTVRAGHYRFAVGTAGSCMLVLQTVLPALMQASEISQLALSGGTHNPLAPSWHFIQRAFAPLLARMGVGLEGRLLRHGFYPAGGGQVDVQITPALAGLKPFSLLERGAALESYGECLAPGLAPSIAERELSQLGQSLGWSPDQLRELPTRKQEGPGNALLATLSYEHVTEVFTHFGEKRLSAASVASNLAAEVEAYRSAHAPVGPHLADQLLLPLALAVRASGEACAFRATEITLHTRTNAEVIQRFVPIEIEIFEADSSEAGHGTLLQVRPLAA
jgi:RNA 3'-terminal phosphate cyclase (ATP)